MQLVKDGDKSSLSLKDNGEKLTLTCSKANRNGFRFSPSAWLPIAEIDPLTRQVRMCAGQAIVNQQEVVLHDS